MRDQIYTRGHEIALAIVVGNYDLVMANLLLFYKDAKVKWL